MYFRITLEKKKIQKFLIEKILIKNLILCSFWATERYESKFTTEGRKISKSILNKLVATQYR